MSDFEVHPGADPANPAPILDYAPRPVRITTRWQVFKRQANCFLIMATVDAFTKYGSGGSLTDIVLYAISGPFGAVIVDRARGRTQDVQNDMATGFLLTVPMVLMAAIAIAMPRVRALSIVSYVTILLWFILGGLLMTVAGVRGCC